MMYERRREVRDFLSSAVRARALSPKRTRSKKPLKPARTLCHRSGFNFTTPEPPKAEPEPSPHITIFEDGKLLVANHMMIML